MKRVLRLMERTGWSYQECARCVLSMNDDAIEAHIKSRREDEGVTDHGPPTPPPSFQGEQR